MRITQYKRLFEVRFLHEYYLSDRANGGALFFSKSSVERQAYLEEEIQTGRYNILKDLLFEPTPETARLLAGRRLKFMQTATGFFIGGEVKQEIQNDIERYKPAIPIENGLRLKFMVRLKNRGFQAFTAMRLHQNDLPALYLFTNAGKSESNTPFVSLAEPAPVFESGNTYESGELVQFSASLQEAVVRTQSIDSENWSTVNAEGYITENDRQVLGKQFSWRWSAAPQNVQFTLINELLPPPNQEVKVILARFTDTNQTKDLDFSHKSPIDGQNTGNPISDGFYTIRAAGEIDTFSKKIYLQGELSSGGVPSLKQGLLGIVQIEATDSTSGIPFLDETGYLRRETLPTGDFTHIIYEVRWLSRSAWWRYRSGQDKELKAVGAALPHLTQSGNDLVSNIPLRFSSSQKPLAIGVNLPNATPDLLRPDPGGRFFADITVTKVPNLIDSI